MSLSFFAFILQFQCSCPHIFNILAAILFFFLLCANGDLYNALLLYQHFRLHSNTIYYNLCIFRVITKNFKKINIAHIVGNNNARMLLLASCHSCYRFGASIS